MNIGSHVRNNVVGYLALFVALSGTAWATGQIGSADIADNAVLSRHIKDGQVKNPDLAGKAVTRPKLGLAAVGPAQLATGAVTAHKLAGNADGSAKVADGSLTGADVQNNSLTGADIDESKLYAQTRTVSPVGTPLQNGQALRDMLASITDASSIKPYVVKVEPGEYDVGGTALQMKNSVDLEGSGTDMTVIDSSVSGTTTVVSNNIGSAVRDLQVAAGANGVAISAGSQLKLEDDLVTAAGSGTVIGVDVHDFGQLVVHDSHVQVSSTGAGNFVVGIQTGSDSEGLSIDDSVVTANASGSGGFASALSVNGSAADVRSSSLVGLGGSGSGGFAVIDNGTASTTTIDSSLVKGSQKAAGANTGDSILIGASKVVGGHDSAAPGTVTCVFSYKDTYVATNATCD
jgi:hypothetical protein